MNLEFEKLQTDFGARIHGINQSDDLDEQLVQALTVGLDKHPHGQYRGRHETRRDHGVSRRDDLPPF
jgi:hypothetical protein